MLRKNPARLSAGAFSDVQEKFRVFSMDVLLYRRLVSQLAKVTRSLKTMVKKGSDHYWYRPFEVQIKSFEELEAALDEPPIL